MDTKLEGWSAYHRHDLGVISKWTTAKRCMDLIKATACPSAEQH